ncbi:MAG: amidohydrolase family protein [Ilumatobacteraceae bacterium]|nr:amidohydrolase family protein [Ilumatobacteraceae bacterium]
MTSPDDELPIRFHPLSNGEYDPLPRSELIHETVRRTIDTADDNARRLGMDRRRFLRTAAGMATTLTTLAACSAEQRAATTSRGTTPTASSGPSSSTSSVPVGTGGTFELPPESTLEEEAATTVLEARDGDLVIDVQTHLLDYPAGTTSGFGFGFPQASCGVDPAECLGVDSWLSLVLGGSDTTVAVLSAIPVVADPDPLSAAVMDRARRQAEVAGCLDRVLIQGHATPTLGTLDQAMEAMAATAIEFDIAAWKAYTHEGPAWRLDDTVGTAFCNQARTLGQQVICVHKGLGPAAASPIDVGPAAVLHPDLAFCIYHSGFERSVTEGPYPGVEAGLRAGGVDRLIASAEQAGVGVGGNVYPELGSTWWNLIQRPDEAAHVLGKLLVAFGEDNILWGTDSLWYGSPQSQIEAFRAFQITDEFQERFGYPPLTDTVKAKILGLNAARVYGIDPALTNCQPSLDDRAALRRAVDTTGIHGPTTRRDAMALFASEHPWFRS